MKALENRRLYSPDDKCKKWRGFKDDGVRFVEATTLESLADAIIEKESSDAER